MPLPNYPSQLTVLRKDEIEGPQSHFKGLILKFSEKLPLGSRKFIRGKQWGKNYTCKISKVKPLGRDRSEPVKTVYYLDINLDEKIIKVILDRYKKSGILLKRQAMMISDVPYQVLLQGTF